MNPEPPVSVFISYSRRDVMLVARLIHLFAAVDVPVFRDEQSIKPGQKWRVAIDAALEQCQTILVFWCEHAARSSEVRSEYDRAILLGKRVVPVLIDDTALAADLGQYQRVDLRMILSERHVLYVLPDGSSQPSGSSHASAEENPSLSRVISWVERDTHPDSEFLRASQQLKSSLTAEFGEYTRY